MQRHNRGCWKQRHRVVRRDQHLAGGTHRLSGHDDVLGDDNHENLRRLLFRVDLLGHGPASKVRLRDELHQCLRHTGRIMRHHVGLLSVLLLDVGSIERHGVLPLAVAPAPNG